MVAVRADCTHVHTCLVSCVYAASLPFPVHTPSPWWCSSWRALRAYSAGTHGGYCSLTWLWKLPLSRRLRGLVAPSLVRPCVCLGHSFPPKGARTAPVMCSAGDASLPFRRVFKRPCLPFSLLEKYFPWHRTGHRCIFPFVTVTVLGRGFLRGLFPRSRLDLVTLALCSSVLTMSLLPGILHVKFIFR